MNDLLAWPAQLPSALCALASEVAGALDRTARILEDLSDADADAGAEAEPLLVILTGGDLADMQVFSILDRIISARTGATALVIGDGWIGTEGPDVASALVGAAAVALARSIAVRRHPTGRVNVVCVPEGLIGGAGSQRGPLAVKIGSSDVADVVAFVLGDASRYIDGQVLYADGGRQLFSSLTA